MRRTKQKRIFRAFSFKTSSYQLARNSLQLIITSIGHFVIYPTIIDKKNATNYIFVSADDKSTPPVIHDKILSYLIPDDINWDTTFSTNSNEENNTIYILENWESNDKFNSYINWRQNEDATIGNIAPFLKGGIDGLKIIQPNSNYMSY